MHRRLIAASLLILAGPISGCGSSTDESEQLVFSIQAPSLTLAAGEETVACYYFRTPNTKEIAVKQWTAQLPGEAVSLMVFVTPNDILPPGTQSKTTCDMVFQPDGSMAYVSQQDGGVLQFPADDGNGKPVGYTIPANQAGFIRVHYVNPSGAPAAVQAKVTFTAYKSNVTVTEANTLITYNASISLAPQSASTETQGCPVPPSVSFTAMTTVSYKHSISTSITDGSTTFFQSNDFTNPGLTYFGTPPFATFSGILTYQCDYLNTTNTTIVSGSSPITNEVCMAVTWFFPATGPRMCVDATLLPSREITLDSPPGIMSLASRSKP